MIVVPGVKVGVMLESFRVPVKQALDLAVSVRATGFQAYVSGGELHPSKLAARDRQEFVKLVESKGLQIAAICGEVGGFGDPSRNADLVAQSKSFLELSVDLGVRIVTGHIGVIPEDDTSPVWSAIAEALEAIGRHGDSVGAVYACETGPEDPALMRRFIDELDTRSIKVNYDPANLVMLGFDPIGGVEHLGDLVVHTPAKDGVRHPDGRPEEVALGTGAVPFAEWVGALRAKGYDWYYTIEREVGDDPYADIETAAKFLATL
jgi:sugar phosphate isomerase/epimerase